MSIQFVEQLEQLKRRCIDMAALVQGAVEQASEAILARRPELASAVLDNEARIDAEEVKIERAAIDMLARHQPAAEDVHTVFAIVKINSDLERIGDCAYNIAQLAASFRASAGEMPQGLLRTMVGATLQQLHDTTRCVGLSDPNLAAQVCRGDDVIDALYHQIYQDMQAGMVADTHRIPEDLALIMVAKNLERIADHCTNVAEEVVFLVGGRIIRHEH